MSGLPCPTCGSELSYLEQYNRHYCYSCGRYAPEGYGDRGAKACPTCGGILSFVTAYDRFYCYRCNAYPPAGADETPKAPPAETATAAEAVEAQPAAVFLAPLAQPEPEESKPEAVENPAEPAPSVEEPTEEEIADETPASPPKPPLVRKAIWQAKKPLLMDLCKAYDLDPTGTKEQLRERLLSYLDELEPAPRIEEEVPVQEAPEGSEDLTEDMEPEGPSKEATPATVPEEIPREESPPATPSAAEPNAPTTAAIPEVIQEPPQEAAPSQPEVVVVVPETPMVREAPRVEHPCPNCSRELTYIPQYNRWYCYTCRAYAPVARSRYACPNCGATLRWIERYERWWCDACRRYAPADLPKPEPVAAAASTAYAAESRPLAQTIAQPVLAHRHRSPGNGIGLIALGLVLFVVYEILVELPTVVTFNSGILLAPDIAWGMRFFGFVLVAGGAMVALAAMRDRR